MVRIFPKHLEVTQLEDALAVLQAEQDVGDVLDPSQNVLCGSFSSFHCCL